MSDWLVGELVYVGYVAGGHVHQLLACIKHIAKDGHIDVRVDQKVEEEHADCFAHADTPPNSLLHLPSSAVLRRLIHNEKPCYVVCSPSLVGQRAKLTRKWRDPEYGRVVRDLWRATDDGQACLLQMDKARDVLRYDGAYADVKLQTSALTEEERHDPALLRARYLGYLRGQVVKQFGGMTRHVVSGVDNGRMAFTYSNCFLKADNHMVLYAMSTSDVGAPAFLGARFRSGLPSKRDVIYGCPTAQSIRKPHPSGRPTLQWINASNHAGLDAFIRFCLFSAEERAAHDPEDVVRSMRGADGKHTAFSLLIQGYYDMQPADNPYCARMLSEICWDFDLDCE